MEGEKRTAILLEIQRLNDKIERVLSDASSEKATRKRTNDAIFSKLQELDALLRGKKGDNGLMSRVALLETVERNEKEENKSSFHKWVSVIAIIISTISIVAHYIK